MDGPPEVTQLNNRIRAQGPLVAVAPATVFAVGRTDGQRGREQEVLRLDVPVINVPPLEVRQGPGHLTGEAQRYGTGQARSTGVAGHKLVEIPVVGSGEEKTYRLRVMEVPVEAGNVGVAQPLGCCSAHV